jgi:hypothetical protein
MKTSYKILLAFAIITLSSLIAFNISTKAKYIKGEFDPVKYFTGDIYEAYNLEKIKLKSFKYLVFNGALITANGKEINFNADVKLNSSPSLANALGLRANLKSILKQHVSHDTLYISFQKNNINEENVAWLRNSPIVIQANNLESLHIKKSYCTIDSLLTGKPFAVTSEDTGLSLNSIKTSFLTLHVGQKSNVTISGASFMPDIYAAKIGQFHYSLAKGSSISIQKRDLFGEIKCLNPSKYIVEREKSSLDIVAAIDRQAQ